MNYYRIRESIDTKIIGRKYPQVETTTFPCSVYDPRYIDAYMYKIAPSNVLLPGGIIWKSARLTDLISSTRVGTHSLVVSDRLCQILENSKNFGMQFLSISITENNGTSHPYRLVHVYDICYELLDLERTMVGHYTSLNFRELLRRNPVKDYGALRKELEYYFSLTEYDPAIGNICLSNLTFRTDVEMDFFALRPVTGGVGFYVSEKLKAQIEAAGCTGMVFTGPDEQYP